MSIADIEMLFKFVGGLGMFLYGMHVMADGLQKSAGGKMKQLLGILTNHRILGVLVGALVTAVIQSSSATTVMVVGFVNAGIISLTQAVGVIMGANIGTTITAWLVSMSEWGQMLKPEFFAPLLIGLGAFVVLFVNKEKYRQVGEILVGFGVLFIGLSFMSSSITPYKDAPIFCDSLPGARKESGAWYFDRRGGDGHYPKLFGFGWYSPDVGPQWCCILEFGDLYYTWTEYRYLCDSAYIQRGSEPYSEAGSGYPSFI